MNDPDRPDADDAMTEAAELAPDPDALEPAIPGVEAAGLDESAIVADDAVILAMAADEVLVVEPIREPEPEPERDAGPDSGASVAAVVEAVAELAQRLERRIDGLQTVFDREIRAEATREKVVDRLHAELQEYKQGLLLNTLRPVFVDLIQLHDDIGKVAVPGPDATPAEQRLVGLMQGFQQGIEDILYRQGVEPFEQEGTTFDPRRQRAVSTVVCDDPSLNKTIANRLRKGFQAGDRVIRPEIVAVYSYKP